MEIGKDSIKSNKDNIKKVWTLSIKENEKEFLKLKTFRQEDAENIKKMYLEKGFSTEICGENKNSPNLGEW